MKLAPHNPSEYGGAGAPTTAHGIITAPEGGTYAEVKVGDRYTDTASGKHYRVSATTASTVTWVDEATP
jgi:hypothetical protein